jgi:GTP-binding protein
MINWYLLLKVFMSLILPQPEEDNTRTEAKSKLRTTVTMKSTAIYRQARYWHSAHQLSQLPADSGWEVAFAGRSNAGKSSAINAITGQRRLARTSKTPGRTQQIIFFQLDEHRRLVDLPGYGFAKAPLAVKRQWQQTLEGYLHTRQSLRGLILMMDIRHPLTEFDQQMLHWCQLSTMPVHILLTKADKISYGKANTTLQQINQHLTSRFGAVTVQLFSAWKWLGVPAVHSHLNHWLEIEA